MIWNEKYEPISSASVLVGLELGNEVMIHVLIVFRV